MLSDTERVRVFKRIGTNLVNPDPVTSMDPNLITPERHDFFFVPRFVNEGTVTPVCYNIIYDYTKLSRMFTRECSCYVATMNSPTNSFVPNYLSFPCQYACFSRDPAIFILPV